MLVFRQLTQTLTAHVVSSTRRILQGYRKSQENSVSKMLLPERYDVDGKLMRETPADESLFFTRSRISVKRKR
jgi:hypothetical protein